MTYEKPKNYISSILYDDFPIWEIVSVGIMKASFQIFTVYN